MAFFKSLFQSSSRSGAPLQLRDGMKVEVLTPANTPIFSGTLRLMSGGVLEVRTQAGTFPPRPGLEEQVRLRGVQENGAAFTLDGTVVASGLDLWRIQRRIERPAPQRQKNDSRDAFRQSTGAKGQILTSSGQMFPCEILDVSAGGVRVLTAKLFQLEATFHLEAVILPGEAPFSLTCQVKRVQAYSKPGIRSTKWEYGCQLVNVPTREQERLLRSLFALQRDTLRRRSEF